MNSTAAYTARIGNLNLYKSSERGQDKGRFVLTTLDGEVLDTFPTARAANSYAVARIAAAFTARKGA